MKEVTTNLGDLLRQKGVEVKGPNRKERRRKAVLEKVKQEREREENRQAKRYGHLEWCLGGLNGVC